MTARRRRRPGARTRPSGQALLQAGDEQVARQLAADEHQDRLLLVLAPGLAHVAAHHHVHALEHDAPRLALHPEHALVAQQVRPVHLDHAGEELLQRVAVEGLLGAEHEGLDFVVVVVGRIGEEFGVELEDRVQVEAADVEDLPDRRSAEMHLRQLRARIHCFQSFYQLLVFCFLHEIGFGKQYPVCKTHLFLRFAELVQLLGRVLGVHHGEDRIEQVVSADILVGEKRLRHGPGVGHAGGLDDDAVELERTLAAPDLQVAEDLDQVAAHRAADAAVVHLDDLLLAVFDDLAVDADLAELVLDHRDALAVVLLEDAVEQRGLARAEKARENGHGNHVFLLHVDSWRRRNSTIGETAVTRALLEKAAQLREKYALGEARHCCEEVLRRSPQDAAALDLMAALAADERDAEAAMRWAQRAIAADPGAAAPHYTLGRGHQAEGRLAEAGTCYRNSLALDANQARAHNNLGSVLQMQGRLAEAMASFRRALAIDPSLPQANQNLAAITRDRGALEAAGAGYRRAAGAHP